MSHETFGIVKDTVEIDFVALPVSQEELRLIKIALFEISEYLSSPKLSELRQRVNSLMEKKSCVVLPADSVFNEVQRFASGRSMLWPIDEKGNRK